MIPSVEQVKTKSAGLLGDPLKRKFTDAKLQDPFELAFLELTGEMQRYHVGKQKAGITYALTASTTSLTPATAGISNFGEIILMEERPYGSSERYTEVTETDFLPSGVQAGPYLRQYVWYDDTWHFLGSNQAMELRIWYYSSGAAPETGTVGIDGSMNFLAYRTASIAAVPSGNYDLADRYDRQARGPRMDCDGGFIHSLVQPMVLSSNKVRLQSALYTAQYWSGFGGGLVIGGVDGGGGSVGAPIEAVLTGDIDGANDIFTLPSIPLRLFLFLNGILLEAGIGYTLSGLTITMGPAYIPRVGDTLRAEVW